MEFSSEYLMHWLHYILTIRLFEVTDWLRIGAQFRLNGPLKAQNPQRHLGQIDLGKPLMVGTRGDDL